MLALAKARKLELGTSNVSFVHGYAEQLDAIPDCEISLVTMVRCNRLDSTLMVCKAMVMHWCQMPHAYEELRRVIKPGGTLGPSQVPVTPH